MEKPKWKERMTEGEIESLYEYELEKGIINMPNAPYYENFNEFLEMARDQVEVITEEYGYRIQYGVLEEDGEFSPEEDVLVITYEELDKNLDKMNSKVAKAVNAVFSGEFILED